MGYDEAIFQWAGPEQLWSPGGTRMNADRDHIAQALASALMQFISVPNHSH